MLVAPVVDLAKGSAIVWQWLEGVSIVIDWVTLPSR